MPVLEFARKSGTTRLHTRRSTQGKVFEEFCADRKTVEALGVTARELLELARGSLLGTLTCKEDVLFLLRQIREATKPKERQAGNPDIGESVDILRRTALANLIESDSPDARTRSSMTWQRIKSMLNRHNHSSPSYRTS